MASGPVHKPSAATALCSPISPALPTFPDILCAKTYSTKKPYKSWGFPSFPALDAQVFYLISAEWTDNWPRWNGSCPTLPSRVAWTRLRQTILRVAAIDPETSWNRMLRQEWQDIHLGRATAQQGQQLPPAAPGDWYTIAAMVFSPELNKRIFHPMHPLWKGGWGRMSVII